MQVIYILSAQIEPVSHSLLHMRQGGMSCVRLRHRSIATAHGIELPYQQWIRFPSFRCGYLLNKIPIPESAGTTECCETAFGRDTRTCKNEETVIHR